VGHLDEPPMAPLAEEELGEIDEDFPFADEDAEDGQEVSLAWDFKDLDLGFEAEEDFAPPHPLEPAPGPSDPRILLDEAMFNEKFTGGPTDDENDDESDGWKEYWRKVYDNDEESDDDDDAPIRASRIKSMVVTPPPDSSAEPSAGPSNRS